MLRQAQHSFASEGFDVEVKSRFGRNAITIPRESDARPVRRECGRGLGARQGRKRNGAQTRSLVLPLPGRGMPQPAKTATTPTLKTRVGQGSYRNFPRFAEARKSRFGSTVTTAGSGTFNVAMNRYPRLGTVSTKRGLSAESPSASRILFTAVFRL